MCKQLLFKSMLLLCALVAGGMSVWADVIESNFTDKDLTVGENELEWTATNVNQFEKSGSARGVQSSKNTTAFVFTSNATQTAALGNIKKVVVTASANANQTINVTVGGKAFGDSQSLPNKTANGEFTFEGEETGTIVVTISRSTSSTAWVKKIVVTYETSSDPRSENGLAYAESEQEVTVGEVLNAPTLTNPNNLTVTYSSNNESIATVDDNGTVTGVAAGTATITATFAGNETFKPGSVSYSLTVKRATVPAVDGVFDFTYADGIDYGTNLTPSNVDIKESKTFTAGNITLTPAPTATNKYWRWYTGGTLRLYTDTKMTIAAADGYVITKIDFVGTQNLNSILASNGTYEAASSNKAATWTGCAQNIDFTRDNANPFFTNITVTYCPATVTVTVGAKGFATLASDYALDFTGKSIKAYTISSADGSKLTLTQKMKVAKGEPVLLYSETANDSQEIPVIAETEATADATNRLVRGADEAITWSETAKFYVLNTTDTPAFYRANNSLVAASKAYLDLTSLPGNARSLSLNFGDETLGIMDANRETMTDNRYYNLNGQRMNQPTKGLYIINGKKVMMK